MTILRVHEPWRLYVVSLAAAMTVFTLVFGVYMVLLGRPVIKAIDAPFEVCNVGKTVPAGGALCYHIKYVKYRDIPGELTKQLVGTDGSVVIPLDNPSGHLPPGYIDTHAYVHIPGYVPPNEYRLKITATHNMGIYVQHSVAWTEPFRVSAKEVAR